MDAKGGLSDLKMRDRKNFDPTWQESHRTLRGGGDRERDSLSRSQMEVVLQSEKSE